MTWQKPKVGAFSFDAAVALVERRGWSAADLGLRAGAPSVGAARKWVHRWKRRGLDEWEADRVATALGVHPAELWGGAWWSGVLVPPSERLDAALLELRWWCAAEARRRMEADANDLPRLSRREIVRGYDRLRPHRCAADGCGCTP
jgi:lambda repressor-like predicted transcriptional regulator